MTNDITSSCGGKRRGCCLIELPHDEQPAVLIAVSDSERSFFMLLGLPAGRSSSRDVVLEADSETADCLGEATW